MIAAAQAAAEAALREAMAQENKANGGATAAAEASDSDGNNNQYGVATNRRQQPQQQQFYRNDPMVLQEQEQDQHSYLYHQLQQQQQQQQHPHFMNYENHMMTQPAANQQYQQQQQQQQQYQQQHHPQHFLGAQDEYYEEDYDTGGAAGPEDEQLMMELLYQQQQQEQQQQPEEQMWHQTGGGQHLQYSQQDRMAMDPTNRFSLFHRQQQHQQQQQQSQQQQSRPREHYMTITNDGTIVEASDSVIGLPPEALLMTSTYDSIFDEDLPGFLCIKSQFWDKQILDVEVIIRRRNVDGDWIWLSCKALQWVEMNTPASNPQFHQAVIPGEGVLVLSERLVEDMGTAQMLQRVIRITAVIVQAAEAARLTNGNDGFDGNGDTNAEGGGGTASDGDPNNNNNHHEDNPNSEPQPRLRRDESGTLLNETIEMEVLLRRLQESRGGGSDFTHDNLHQLLEIAASHGKGGNGGSSRSGGGGNDGRKKTPGSKKPGGDAKNQKDQQQNVIQRSNFDPYAIIESVRKGTRLDLGTTSLSTEEVRLLTMVLTGKLHVDDVAPLVWQSLQPSNNMTLSHLLDWQEQQYQQQQQQMNQGNHNSRRMNQLQNYQFYDNQQNNKNRRGVPKSCLSSSPFGTSPQDINSLPSFVCPPPPIAVVNLSYTYIGNAGVEKLADVLWTQGTALKTLDISFCGIDEKGFLLLAKALAKRKKRTTMGPIKGLILSGNYVTHGAASALGTALAISTIVKRKERRRHNSKRQIRSSGGYDSDSSDSEDDEDFDDFSLSPTRVKRRRNQSSSDSNSGGKKQQDCCNQHSGIQVLHLASTSLKAGALGRLLEGLGPHSSMRELNLASNHFGPAGVSVLSRCLDANASLNSSRSNTNQSGTHVPLPYLDRIDISNNSLGDDGATQLTKIISSRSKVDLVDLRLSSNSITASGIEKIMNKLLHHNLVSLALDKNAIGDQGCQLIAASLQSMKSLSRLNLSFNQIGSRGINSLMRSLIACESVTFVGLSGNILKISGAMALAFTLAQHPRLEELHLDNCCLGQAAQCHITAGIISNRWVPMKRLAGYAVGPPMVAIGALKPYAQNLSNEECFRIRKDEQMKTILQWMENHRGSNAGKMDPQVLLALGIGSDSSDQRFLTPEFVSNINDVHGIPSQNAYFRMLGWLSSIPFDDDELTVLQKYFYDVDGGDGDRGSDGYINLKLRGDLLAALDSEVAEEIRDVMPPLGEALKGSVGIDLEKLDSRVSLSHSWTRELSDIALKASDDRTDGNNPNKEDNKRDSKKESDEREEKSQDEPESATPMVESSDPASAQEMENSQHGTKEKKNARAKPRISMFPKFEQQLEQLKSAAAEMIEQEEDPMHHEVILTQYAEASLTILRQLRYHCMNSGLDGWRQGGMKRKILVIDDSRIIRRMVSRAFEDANFIVDTAANGAEGVEKMKASIYDIAFMDIDMPVMNGFEATKKLREWEDKQRPGARQPICALTAAYVDDFERSELIKYKEAGLDVMESKPCNIPRLLKVVDDVSPMFSNLRLDATQQERSNGRTSN